MKTEYKEFKLHIYKGYIQNNFLVEYKDKILLLDGACKPDADHIAEFVTKNLGRKISDLKLIAVTHCHPDHAGAAGIIREKYNVPVAAPRDIDLWYSGIGGTVQYISDTLQTAFMASKSKVESEPLFYKRLIKPDYLLDDLSPLPFFEDWKAIHAPGHTFHNVMFYNEKEKIIYIADTMIDANNKFLPPVPVLFPVEMKETLQKIKKIKPEIILFAHSESSIMGYQDNMIDQTIKKIDSEDSVFIRFFYLISKFTGEYRKNKSKPKTKKLFKI